MLVQYLKMWTDEISNMHKQMIRSMCKPVYINRYLHHFILIAKWDLLMVSDHFFDCDYVVFECVDIYIVEKYYIFVYYLKYVCKT